MVVQGSGGWKGSTPQNKPSNNAGKHPAAARKGGAHTLSDLPQDTPQQQTSRGLGDSADSPQVKRVPEYNGRPVPNGISFREMFFPWYKLLSVTTIICVINWCYFIAELIYGGAAYSPQQAFVSSNKMGGPSSWVLKVMGAKYTPDILNGHVWRLFTAVFMHSGILHIALNTFFLLRFGFLTEARFGSLRYTALYIFGGLIANVYSAILNPLANVSCGASGALFAVLASCIYFAIRHYKQMRTAMCEIIMVSIILIFNFLMGFLGSGGTDNWAHLFGAIGGFLFAICVLPLWHTETSPKTEKKIKIGFSIFVLVWSCVSIVLIWVFHDKRN